MLVVGNVRLVAICADAGVGQCSLSAALAIHELFSWQRSKDLTYRIAVVGEGLAAADRVTGVELGTAPILTRRQRNAVGLNGVLAISIVASLVGLGTSLVDCAGGLGARRALGAGRALSTDEASESRGGDEEGGVKHVVTETSI